MLLKNVLVISLLFASVKAQEEELDIVGPGTFKVGETCPVKSAPMYTEKVGKNCKCPPLQTAYEDYATWAPSNKLDGIDKLCKCVSTHRNSRSYPSKNESFDDFMANFSCVACSKGSSQDPEDPVKCQDDDVVAPKEKVVIDCPPVTHPDHTRKVYDAAGELKGCAKACPDHMVEPLPGDPYSRCTCPVGETQDKDGNCCPKGLIFNFKKSVCERVCPEGETWNSDTMKCECPEGYEKTCETCRCLPKRPYHKSDDGLEVIPAGDRRDSKGSIGLHSLAPLDRLLNQMNTEDQITVLISCYPRKFPLHPGDHWSKTNSVSNEMTFTFDDINRNKPVDKIDLLSCAEDHDFAVQLYKRDKKGNPLSLGYSIVTREMIQCLGDNNKIKIYFEFSKRQEFAGTNTCFDDEQYTKVDGRPHGSIPFTVMNICHKTRRGMERCYLNAYQVTLLVNGPIDVKPKMFTKLIFKNVSGLVVLPGDQIKATFTSTYTEKQNAARVMPDIFSGNLPSPIKERYISLQGSTRLPCDDRKVADNLQCEDFYVYCTNGDDKVSLTVQGSGEILGLDTTCAELMNQAEGFNWDDAEKMLADNMPQFMLQYSDKQFKRKTFPEEADEMLQIAPQGDVPQMFDFKYEVGHRLHTDTPRCFQNVYMPPKTPDCKFKCSGRSCFLVGPEDVVTNYKEIDSNLKLAGPDVQASREKPQNDPLNIPTENIADKFLYMEQGELNKQLQRWMQDLILKKKTQAKRMLQDSVIEGQFTNGIARLSTDLGHHSINYYEYRVQDKLSQDTAPPSNIKIEKLPMNGKISVTQHDGSTKELAVDDVVSTKQMQNFMYEQGKESCANHFYDKCNDDFTYQTRSSWIGIGEEAIASIKLTPVFGPKAAESQIIVTPIIEQKQEEELNVAAPAVTQTMGCKLFPQAMINVEIGIFATLVVIVLAQAGYYMQAKKAMDRKRAARNTKQDFNNVVEVEIKEPEPVVRPVSEAQDLSVVSKKDSSIVSKNDISIRSKKENAPVSDTFKQDLELSDDTVVAGLDNIKPIGAILGATKKVNEDEE